MAHRYPSVGHHNEHLVGQIEQPQCVRDRRAALADLIRHLILCQSESFYKSAVSQRLLDRRKIAPLNVFHQRYLSRAKLVAAEYYRRDLRKPRHARGAPAALAGDYAVHAGVRKLGHDYGLKHTKL